MVFFLYFVSAETLTLLTCIRAKFVTREMFSHSSAEGGDVYVLLSNVSNIQSRFGTSHIHLVICFFLQHLIILFCNNTFLFKH